MPIASRINSSGNFYINGKLDEVTNNPATTGSISFNGTDQYLTIPTDTNYNLGSNDFAVEGWIYPSSVTGTHLVIERRTSGGFVAGNWGLYMINANLIFFSYEYNSAGTAVLTSGTLAINTWYHFALVRNGASIALYINGTSAASTTSVTIATGTVGLTIGADVGSGIRWYWSGYISNLRIVNGTAIYTANFTPQIYPLTAVTNTVLLLNTPFVPSTDTFLDTSTVAATVTQVATPTSSSVSPFTASIANNAAVQTLSNTGTLQISGIYDEVTMNRSAFGSLLFDGTSGYITAPDSVNLQLSTGDFTVEGWFYLNALGAVRGIVAKGGGSTGWEVRVTSANLLAASYTSTALTGTTTVTSNVWHHFAFVRSGVATGNIKLYLNGTLQVSSLTAITTDFTQTNVLVVGNSRTVNQFFSGNICNVRILKGTALYTAAFTPPVEPPTAVTNTQFLLNPPNTSFNNILDTSTNYATLTKVGTVTSSPQTPLSLDGFYNYSFNGATPDYLSFPANANYLFGSNDFTIEMWVWPSSLAATQGLTVSHQTGGEFQWNLNTTGKTAFSLNINNGATSAYSTLTTTSTTSTLSLYTWTHIAAVRYGNTFKIYVNGVADATTLDVTGVTVGSYLGNKPIYVGTGADTGSPFTGYISNLRIVNGTAIYTGTFTPPSEPLTAITNTKLLSCKSNKIVDSSSIGATITRTGSVAVNSNTTPFTTYNYAGSGFAVRRAASDGKFQITGDFDEWTGAPVVDSSLKLWWDAGQPSSYSGSGSTFTDLSGNANTRFSTFSTELSDVATAKTVTFGAVPLNSATANGYTVEFFVKFRTLPTSGLSSFGSTTSNRLGLEANTSAMRLVNSGYTQAGDIVYRTFENDVWYHFAYIGRNASTYIAIDGQVTNLNTIGGTVAYTATGTWPNGWHRLSGNAVFSNFRAVTNEGGNVYDITGFVPPAAPLTAISNTKILTLIGSTFVDASGIGTSVTTAGSPTLISDTVDVSEIHTGTLNNSPTFNSLIGGGSLLFNGTNQTASLASLNLQQDFTLETWVNQNALNGFAMFGQGGAATSQGLHIWYTAAGTIRFGMYGNDTDFTVSTSTGVWYHMVFTYNNSSPYTKGFYLNAVAQSGTAQQAQAAYTGTGIFRLGATYSSGGNYGSGYFQGAKAYNRILTADEVTTNYNALKGRYGL